MKIEENILRFEKHLKGATEIFEILNKNGIINKEELEKAKRIVFLRNLIAHEYYRIEEKDLKNMVDFLEEMRNFINKVKKMVKEGEL
jgi:uncharacterized protein YutE (UPF0331/DUF86 family)